MATNASSLRRRLFLYPDPVRAPDVPPPPTQARNPRIYGWFLVASAFLMEWLGFIRKGAWDNASFGCLRDIWEHLALTEPRYDPTVYPVDDLSAEWRGDRAEAAADEEADVSASSSRPNSAAAYRALYLSGQLTPLDVARAILPLIRRDTSPPGQHSIAWLEVHADLVLEAARASTLRYQEKRSLGPLDGVPTGVKDEFDMKGYRTSLGAANTDYSRLLKAEHETDKDAWCVRNLQAAGAIVLGKLSLHEFGLDTPGYNITYGTPRNPYNQRYYLGGSSSGSAYAVAAGLVPLTLGSDGGGSIRIPASFCSAFGLKPTHNRVSFFPGQNHANTAGVNGPIAADMASLIALYNVLNTPHPGSSFPAPSRPLRLRDEARPKVLGVPEAWFARASPAVQELCRSLIGRLVSQKGYTVVPVPMPLVRYGQIAHAITLLTDAAALVPDTSGVSPANRILLALGRTTPAADFMLAQKLRRVLMQHLAWLFEQHPGLIMVTPTTACAGWPIRSEAEIRYGISDGDQTMETMEYVWLANFCGVPSITVPAGYAPPEQGVGEGDVPVGLMGLGEWCDEEALLSFGLDAEEVGLDLQRRPPGWVDVVARARESHEAGDDGDETASVDKD